MCSTAEGLNPPLLESAQNLPCRRWMMTFIQNAIYTWKILGAQVMLEEILGAKHGKDVLVRCSIIPVAQPALPDIRLGEMVDKKRFKRPTCVFLDGDSPAMPGCTLLPGDDAPEQVVFKTLKPKLWGNMSGVELGGIHPKQTIYAF